MKANYSDIVERISEEPLWWDEHGTPRYAPFEPRLCANIYSTEVVLVEIRCQSCRRPFLVCLSWSDVDLKHPLLEFHKPLTPETVQLLHYGDPPNVECCAVGATMNSVPVRVVEAWRRHEPKYLKTQPDTLPCISDSRYFDFQRVPELEVPIQCDWAKEE